MKIRNSFVGNSSSSSFLIVNKTDKEKTFADFLKAFSNFKRAIYIEYKKERVEELENIEIKPEGSLTFSFLRDLVDACNLENENFKVIYLHEV